MIVTDSLALDFHSHLNPEFSTPFEIAHGKNGLSGFFQSWGVLHAHLWLHDSGDYPAKDRSQGLMAYGSGTMITSFEDQSRLPRKVPDHKIKEGYIGIRLNHANLISRAYFKQIPMSHRLLNSHAVVRFPKSCALLREETSSLSDVNA